MESEGWLRKLVWLAADCQHDPDPSPVGRRWRAAPDEGRAGEPAKPPPDRRPSPFRATDLRSRVLEPSPIGRGAVLQVEALGMAADGADENIRIIQHLLVGETQHGPAQFFDHLLPVVVVEDHVITGVDAAVDLDHQAKTIAGEVGIEAADGMLASEFMAVDAASAQTIPDAGFGKAGRLTQGTGGRCTARLHGLIIQSIRANFQAVDPHPFALPIATLPEAQALSQWERVGAGGTLPLTPSLD